MTVTDKISEEMVAHSTSGSSYAGSTALSLILLCTQMASSPLIQETPQYTHSGTSGSVIQPESLNVDAVDVFFALNRIYDELLTNQVDLDSTSKQAIYDNLWDLYG